MVERGTYSLKSGGSSMGKLMWFIILVLAAVAIYVSWPEIQDAMAPKEEPNRPDKVTEGLRKIQGVYTGARDPNYHCSATCPERIGGTKARVAIEKAKAAGYTPCSHCCD
jgi:hypothetical protein